MFSSLTDSSSFAETPVTTGMTQEAPVTTDMTWEAAEEHVTGLSQATTVSKKWCWAASAHRGDKGRCVTQRTWKTQLSKLAHLAVLQERSVPCPSALPVTVVGVLGAASCKYWQLSTRGRSLVCLFKVGRWKFVSPG